MSEKLFSADGTLMSTGLLHLCKASEEELDDRFELLGDDDQCGSVMNEQISPEAFYSRRIVRAPKANLTLDDYSHIPAVKNLLIPYLAKVLQTRKTGVNILIYGPPGTGKRNLRGRQQRRSGRSFTRSGRSAMQRRRMESARELPGGTSRRSFTGRPKRRSS
ncbi:MAG: hypothetical protein V8T46_11820 [Sutterella seckii]